MGRKVDRHAGERRGEVGAVIEVEAAKVVLVGLALAAVLTDDDAGDGLEDFARPHDRPRVELSCGDRALTGRLRHTDEVLGRVLHVRQVREGALAGHRHVGIQGEVQDGLERCTAGGGDGHLAPRRREIDQSEDDLVAAWRNLLDAVATLTVAHSPQCGAAWRAKLHRHARQRATGFVADRTCYRGRLGRGAPNAARYQTHHQQSRADRPARKPHLDILRAARPFGCRSPPQSRRVRGAKSLGSN
jgi:hypothetical protein